MLLKQIIEKSKKYKNSAKITVIFFILLEISTYNVSGSRVATGLYFHADL